MGAVLAVGPPARNRVSCTPTEVSIPLVHRTPGFPFAADFQVKELAQVMTKRGNKCCVLPTRTISGATEAIDSAVRLPLHKDVALELLQCLLRHFEGMTVQATWLGVVVPGAGWQVAYRVDKPVEQPLSQRPDLHVKRQPVQDFFFDLFD